MQVAILDYGMGNIGSLEAMAHRLGVDAIRWRQGSLPKGSDWVILPGVGSLLGAIEELSRRDLIGPLNAAYGQEVPILGICLGLQLLFEDGAEGGRGLGWLRGSIPELLVKPTPHMGWNTVRPMRPNTLIGPSTDWSPAYYFVHSYVVQPDLSDVIWGETTYAGQRFVSVVKSGPLVGVQFHPELSGQAGRDFVQAFLKGVVL